MSGTFAFEAWAEARLTWSDLAARLALPVAETFPLPVPAPGQDVGLRASVGARAGGDPTPPAFQLRFEIEYPVYEFSKFGLTFGRTCRLILSVNVLNEAGLDAARQQFDNPSGDPSLRLAGDLTAEISFRLPALPEMDFLRVRTGDAEGWMRLLLAFHAETNAAGDAILRIQAALVDLVHADVAVPGLAVPLGYVAIDSAGGALEVRAGAITGTITGRGRVSFRPQFGSLGLPMAEYLAELLDAISPDEVVADITIGVNASGAEPSVTFQCELTGAGPGIDLFGVLTNITRGGGNPADAIEAGSAGTHPEGSFGFEVAGFYARISKTPEFAVRLRARLGPVSPEAYLKLTTTDVEIGLGRATPDAGAPALTIPLRIPHISRKDMGFEGPVADAHRDASQHPPDQAIWEKLSPNGRDRYDASVEIFMQAIELVTGATPSGLGLIEGEQDPPGPPDALYPEGRPGDWHITVRNPPPTQLRDPIPIRPAVGTVVRRDAAGRKVDTGNLLFAVEIEDRWHVLAANPALELENFAFKLSLRNPRNFSVSGTARFVVDGPLYPLRYLPVSVGISPDLIFFSAKNLGGQPIEIPELIPGYGGGKLIFGRLAVGIGYTKRSFAVAFDGGIVLPERFVDDLDTSDQVGAGIRIPVQSRLSFQFDVIPVVLGEVVIPFPTLMFNIDFRQDVSPGLVDPRLCEPFWDGLQLIVNDVIRMSFKHLSYNPMFAIGCMSNSEFDGDLVLGDANNGLSIVADNIFWAYGPDSFYALSIYPIASIPFLDNFCVSLRLGGFALHFHLERPTPSFSPFAVFELLALLADPMHYPVSPRGELANMVRASLNDAYITLPESARRLFPQAEAVLRKPVNITINLATFITLVQTFAQALETVASVASAAVRDAADSAHRAGEVGQRLLHAAQSLRPSDVARLVGQLLRSLPPELRKMRWRASFGGFDANAVLVLMDPEEAAAALDRRDTPAEDITPVGHVTLEMSGDPAAMRGFVPLLTEARRMVDAADPAENPLRGSEFDGFTAADLESLPPRDARDRPAGTGVMIAANVSVFGGQRVRFIGLVYENGSFALVSRASVRPFILRLPGIDLPVELKVSGGLALTGRAQRHAQYALIRGSGAVDWVPFPALVRVLVNAALAVRGDGAFSASGTGEVKLFGGRATVGPATIEFDRMQCRLAGTFDWSADSLLALHASVHGQIGPGPRYEIEGDGSLTVLGMEFPDFHVAVSGHRIEVGGKVRIGNERPVSTWSPVWGALAVPLSLDLDARGAIDPTDSTDPDVSLTGAAKVELDGLGATLTGQGGIIIKDGVLSVFAEGTLEWMERDWLGARVELGANEVSLSAETSFAINPPNAASFISRGTAVSVTGLHVQASLKTRLSITRASGGIGLKGALELRGQVMAGLKLAEQQIIPIAAASVSVTFENFLTPFRIGLSGNRDWRETVLRVRGAGPVPTQLLREGLNLSDLEAPTVSVFVTDQDDFTFVTGGSYREPDGSHALPWIDFDKTDITVPKTLGGTVTWPQDSLQIPNLLVPPFNIDLIVKWNGAKFSFEVEPTPA